MQSAEDYFAAALSIPARQFIGAFSKREMHADADDFRHRVDRRLTLKQVFIPISHSPVWWRRARDRGQRECRCQHVFAETAMRRLRIERIDEEGEPALDTASGWIRIQFWRR